MSNITNINEQRYDDIPAADRYDENTQVSAQYNAEELSIKAKFDKIIEAVRRGDVYNSNSNIKSAAFKS